MNANFVRTEFNKRIKTLKLDQQAKEELFDKFKNCWGGGFKCFYCKRKMDLKYENEYGWTIDHTIPKAYGGKDEVNNLEFVCRLCNFLKGKMDPERYIKNLLRLKSRKERKEYWKARKSTKKDERTREAYNDIFERMHANEKTT